MKVLIALIATVVLTGCSQLLEELKPTERKPFELDARFVLLVAPRGTDMHAFRDYSEQDCLKAREYVLSQMPGTSPEAYCVPMVVPKKNLQNEPKAQSHPH